MRTVRIRSGTSLLAALLLGASGLAGCATDDDFAGNGGAYWEERFAEDNSGSSEPGGHSGNGQASNPGAGVADGGISQTVVEHGFEDYDRVDGVPLPENGGFNPDDPIFAQQPATNTVSRPATAENIIEEAGDEGFDPEGDVTDDVLPENTSGFFGGERLRLD